MQERLRAGDITIKDVWGPKKGSVIVSQRAAEGASAEDIERDIGVR